MFTPETVLHLLYGVDIDSDYSNTFSFSTLEEQTMFFKGKTWTIHSDIQYMRKENAVRVNTNIEAMYNLSYLMFQNSNFGNKWFYAFITDMKYINDSVTEIYFEIDVLQTWYFDMDYKDCYIEREHVADDTIGLHLVEEGLNIGEVVVSSYHDVPELEPLTTVISTTTYKSGEDVYGGTYGGVYSGNALYTMDTPVAVNEFIDDLSTLGKADAINNIFMMPKNLVQYGEDPNIPVDTPVTLNYTLPKHLTTLDGYTPRNKKLYCYPYNFLMVSNNHGDDNIYPYEYFLGDNAEFLISSDITASPTVYLVPKNYKQALLNFEEKMTLTGYPICNWSTDIYKIWQAQNAVTNAVSVGGSLLSLGAGIATGNPMAMAGGVLGVAGSIGSFYEKSIKPNPIKGSVSGTGNVALGIQNFMFFKKTIRAEFAKMIDKFFDRFGYKVNELKTPNIKTRQTWNYFKMHEVNISGNIPGNDLKRIHSIFKNGVTFWHSDNVGNYTLSNQPL